MVTAKFINLGGAKMDLFWQTNGIHRFAPCDFGGTISAPSPHSLTMAQPQSCEKTTVAKAMTRKSSIKRRVVM